MSSSRGYHMHQRTGRVSASARESYDIGAASSANTIFVPTKTIFWGLGTDIC
jgi:hypothetical protein